MMFSYSVGWNKTEFEHINLFDVHAVRADPLLYVYASAPHPFGVWTIIYWSISTHTCMKKQICVQGSTFM